MKTTTWEKVGMAALVFLLAPTAPRADKPTSSIRPGGAESTFYVATDGLDDSKNGSSAHPFATINYAAEHVPDGSTIQVRPGMYKGRVSLGRQYVKGITIKSETPYRALLRNHDEKVIRCWACAGVTIEGFDVAHDGPGAAPIVIQIDGGGRESKGAHDVVIRNNVLHDSYRNDILKINNGARNIRVEGNVFYNQASHDEHIDVNSCENVVIEDNVFFNDFAGSGRTPPGDSASFIVIKDSNDDEDGIVGSRNITVRRNVFLGWQGGRAYGFVLVGEDGKSYFEARDVMVENNLFLGDSPAPMRSPFGIKGAAQVVFRNNTVLGNLPGKAFATRINREGDNRPGDGIAFYNNIWDDPSGSMTRFSETDEKDVGALTLSHNLYWNGGAQIPFGREDVMNHGRDGRRVTADPGLPDPKSVVPPRWVPERNVFADGSASVAEVRRRLIERYARPSATRAVLARGDAKNAPVDDIRGRPRRGAPTLGALELGDRERGTHAAILSSPSQPRE